MNSNQITSKDNQKLKLIRKLKQKKHRYKEGKFVIESKKLIDEAIANGLKFDFILLDDQASDDYKMDQVFITSQEIFKTVSEMTNPDGYLGVVYFPMINVGEVDQVLLLDGLNDPGNLGTIIRSAEAFGFRKIFLLNSVDPFNEKTLRASMGSIFKIDLVFVEAPSEIADLYTIYVADMDGKDYRQESFEGKICLVIGNEANGISKELFDLADKKVKIPMQGSLESLNAGVSASILMNEINYRKKND